jgi:tellurite resistance protein TerC
VVLVWIAFLIFIFILLALDLGVFHRKAHVISVREALTWTVIWIATTLAFAGLVYLGYEHHWLGLGMQPDAVDRSAAFPDGRPNDARSALVKFLTGYVIELSLSADNVFVIAMLFGYFAIPQAYQHRVLFWGILGALAMRGAMIAIGAKLVAEFAWILPVFGAFLILTAVKMALMGDGHGDPGQNFVVRLMRRFLPVTDRFDGEHFFVRAPVDDTSGPQVPAVAGNVGVRTLRRGGWMLTPLAPALVVVETTDLVFAVDSIPAIFAITADPFLVFTSNVFAILGLRSLYFALAGALHMFRYLKQALALVLLTVGIKMLAHSWLEQVLGPSFNLYLLAVVLFILAGGVLVSLIERSWHDQIGRSTNRMVRAVQQAIVPDRLITTIAQAGRRAALRNAAARTRRRDAERPAPRPSPIATFWRQLFRGKGSNLSILVAHYLAEADGFAMLLDTGPMFL